jgi:proteasome lid subunit RPN8/RPN11
MLILPREFYDAIVAHGKAALPYEACGLVAGLTGEGGERVVTKVYMLDNIDESAEHYSMAPDEQFRVIADIRKRGESLIGNFHSHPTTPARPSEEDIRLAYDPELIYMILSLAEEEPVLKSFIIRNGNGGEENMRLI